MLLFLPIDTQSTTAGTNSNLMINTFTLFWDSELFHCGETQNMDVWKHKEN